MRNREKVKKILVNGINLFPYTINEQVRDFA